MFAEARKLSLFKTLEDMDEVVNKFKMIAEKYMKRGKKNFFAVVELLRRYACKSRGTSFCSVGYMVKKLEISERTIQRIITRLVDLGLVKRIPMVDQKTGTQWPNCYQLQSKIDWNHVVDSLAPDLVAMTDELPIDQSDTGNVTQDDTGDVTPPISDKPMASKPFWAIPEKGSFLYSLKSNKKNNEYKPTISFPFYNWLENSASKSAVQQNNKIQLPDYLLR